MKSAAIYVLDKFVVLILFPLVIPALAGIGLLCVIFGSSYNPSGLGAFHFGLFMVSAAATLYSFSTIYGAIRDNGVHNLVRQEPFALVTAITVAAAWKEWALYPEMIILTVAASLLAFFQLAMRLSPKTKGSSATQYSTGPADPVPSAKPNESEWAQPTYAAEVIQKSAPAPRAAPKKSRPDLQFPAVPSDKTFADIVGMDDLKRRLYEAGQEITGANGEQSATPRNGVLLWGEPGNGKTLFAEALAGQLRLPIISMSFGDVNSKYIGATTENVRQLFKDAREQAPCVLFLDEVDSVLGDRSKTSTTDQEGPKTTNVILTELVALRKTGVVVVAATNYLEKLDAAAIREGRFDFKIEVPPPDLAARTSILQRMAKRFPGIELSIGGVAQAAKRWEGFSAARLSAIAEETFRIAQKSGTRTIDYDGLKLALRTIQGRKGRLPENTLSIQDLTFPAEQKARVQGLADRMTRIEEIEAMGGRAPTGVLLSGPPGTGKTAVAMALAKASGWAFLARTGNELISDPEIIDATVREAKELRPCIIFIDEADDVLRNRAMSQGYASSVTNRLLTAINGAGGKTADILWIAATNHPEQIDSAALRGGRFTEKIELALPDDATLATFVASWVSNSAARFAPDATPQKMAQVLSGLSIGNVAAILQRAVDLMVERALAAGGQNIVATLADVAKARSIVVQNT